MSDLSLQHITLTNFRNYHLETIRFCDGLNCLTGKNGMGKTNLLDAIYYLSMCRSRLNSLDKYVLRHEADFIRLEGHFNRKEKKERIVAKVIPRKSKVIERNDVPYKKFSEHIGLVPIIIIMPDDTLLIREGSEERRRFIDNTLSQIDAVYLQYLIRYNQLLKQRNALLKQSDGSSVDYALLATYDQQMALPAKIVHEKRRSFIEQFLPLFQNWYKGISKDAELVDIQYQSQLNDGDFMELTKRGLQKDVILQRTNVGIHKDDLAFKLADHTMKRFASQGQLKSFVLSLGLARYEVVRKYQKLQPILLLDDIFDKLDEERVKQLLTLLSERSFGQIFLTDTHVSRIKEVIANFKRNSCIYNVQDGQVQLIEKRMDNEENQ